MDVAWIASDRDGYVAYFATSGMGPIPSLALNSLRIPFENLEAERNKLPRNTDLCLNPKFPNHPDTAIAKRGFFVYDYLDVHRIGRSRGDWLRHAYEIITTPTHPVTVDMLPSNIRDHIKGLSISSIAFAEEEQVNIQDYFGCCKHN